MQESYDIIHILLRQLFAYLIAQHQFHRPVQRQKVPGLRNVALTAPYFHRGDVPTLDGAVKLMLRYQVGKELPQEDVDDIVAFLHSLNGVYTPYMQDKQ